jgi:hypothetical protein
MLREITTRYLPPEKVPAYLEFAKVELGEQVAIYLRPQRWLTADLGPGSMPPSSLPDGTSVRRREPLQHQHHDVVPGRARTAASWPRRHNNPSGAGQPY